MEYCILLAVIFPMRELEMNYTFGEKNDQTSLSFPSDIQVDAVADHVFQRLRALGASASAHDILLALWTLSNREITDFQFDNKKPGEEHVAVSIRELPV